MPPQCVREGLRSTRAAASAENDLTPRMPTATISPPLRRTDEKPRGSIRKWTNNPDGMFVAARSGSDIDTLRYLFPPRCAHPVVRFSTIANSSYIAIAITPMTTNPANASPICIDDPADMSR